MCADASDLLIGVRATQRTQWLVHCEMSKVLSLKSNVFTLIFNVSKIQRIYADIQRLFKMSIYATSIQLKNIE